jgi:hypothetical protein
VEAASRTDAELRKCFEERYGEWLQYRDSPKVRFSSDPAARGRGEAFDGLVRLGTEALPLLMEKMAKGDFFCLQAIWAIRAHAPPSERERIPTLSGEELGCSEQEKASLILKRWYEMQEP